MRLFLVRHGETDWNKERRIQGATDIPLNSFGRYLAEETAKGLKAVSLDVCFSSPLMRAYETAEIILRGRDVQIFADNRLIEMRFGEWEGKRCTKSSREVPERFQDFFDNPEKYTPCEEGEDFAALKRRCEDFLSWLFGEEEYTDKNILITTHGCTLLALLMCIRRKPVSGFWGDGVHYNCGVTEVEVKGQEARVISENQIYYHDEVEQW